MHKKHRCRICKGSLIKVFSLGNQPIANNLLDTPAKVETYPLDLYKCKNCTLIQLGYVIPRTKLYDNYLYIPSVSKTHLKHFENLSDELIKYCDLKESDLVLDIGSSDGSLLNCFKKKGMRVLGIEPAKNIESSVDTIHQYFNKQVGDYINYNYGRAKLITATNVFAHIDDLEAFLNAVSNCLSDDGVFFAQFPDVRNLLAENQFDTIYHEHLSYFTYEPLYWLFTHPTLELYKIDNSTIHGGSMRIYVRKRKHLLREFVDRAPILRNKIKKTILKYKKQGKRIVGFGAAAKGTVLLNYCGLDNSIIDYVVDGTPYKQNKFIPGVNIPILPESELDKEMPPDVILILAWNFKEEIMEKLKDKGFTFVVPIPDVQIYE